MTPSVLLLSPGILKWTDMDFGLPHLVSLGGYVQAHTGVRVEILDLNYEGGDHASLRRTLDELGPFLVIGVSTYSSFDRMRALSVARFLRDAYPDTLIVTGGYHASAVPDDLLFDGSPFDVVMKGEAEELLADIVRTLLGGGTVEPGVHGPGKVRDLDALPPMRWELLNRYWPRALQLGRKLQVYLARGCPYRCTFCMERSKSGYQWRAYSPERAVEELERLASFTDLSQWVVNIADPLFGFQRRWRREVLEGILAKGLLPRQYWTLTRSDDLGDEDIELLARARFSIGIGLESGSPDMLRLMNKGNKPDRYLAAVEQLSALSHKHGLNWAVNVIVGHPGETPQTAQETAEFVRALFSRTPTTRGFLSIDPFRLYPGSFIHETMDDWERDHGARFYHRDWWRAWYDHGFLAQHLDPSHSMTFEQRTRFMHDTYLPLLQDIKGRFTGQDRSIDAVYHGSMRGQIDALSPTVLDATLSRAAVARTVSTHRPEVRVPLGMNQKDPAVRNREAAVRRLLDSGVLRSESVVRALLDVSPERYLPRERAEAMVADRMPAPDQEGAVPDGIDLTVLATALEALEPEGTVCDAAATNGYVAALLSEITGPSGRVLVRVSGSDRDVDAVRDTLAHRANVTVHHVAFDAHLALEQPVDRLYLGAALPRVPRTLTDGLNSGGRAVLFTGPRFRAQTLTVVDRTDEGLLPHRVRRAKVPVLAGLHGWMRSVAANTAPAAHQPVRFTRRPAPAFCYHLLSHLDLGADAANLYVSGTASPEWVEPLKDAYQRAPGRLTVQAHALRFTPIDRWLDALATSAPESLQDDAGQRLVRALLDAADAERETFDALWTETRGDASQRLVDTSAQLARPLARLRETLWTAQPTPPPPLTVVHVSALGPAGRATHVGGERVVAVSLDQPLSHILMQVLHEEMHPLTDPIVLAELGGGDRDTRQAADGYAVHDALEQTAVMATQAFLEQKAPELMPDFRRWTRRLSADSGRPRPASGP